jgi:hypothetical protein
MPQDWSWINSWWAHRIPDNAKVLFFSSLAATVVTTCINLHGDALRRRALARGWLLMVPFFSAIVFWFFSAPDIRFLGRLLELMFACSVWSMICSLDRQRIGTPTVWVWPLYFFANVFRHIHFTALLVCIMFAFCFRLLPVPGTSWPALPEADARAVNLQSGLRVQVPVDGSCWFNQLPCAPSVDSRLEYRDPLRADPMAHGFRLHKNP